MPEAEVARRSSRSGRSRRAQPDAFERTLLPLTRERAELALAAYRGGRGELARCSEAAAPKPTRISSLAQELERARAWAALNYLLLDEAHP